MEIHEEFRIKINDNVKSWCYYPPLDVIIYENKNILTIIEATTGCINKSFNYTDTNIKSQICIDVIGKQKLAIACGNIFNCRSKFNDVLLGDSLLQIGSSDYSGNCNIDLPMPEALMLLEALKTVSKKWEDRFKLGFQCSLDLQDEENQNQIWKWNLVMFNCPSTVFYDWLMEINVELNENFPALPLISSIIYRIKSLKMTDYEIRLFIYDRFKEVMNIEANRFLSFEIWPHKTYKWATPELMAKVGFYHHPRRINDDRALCFLCNICLITWEATDEPWSEHQRHSPNCPLFKHNYTSNVPLSITEATTTAQKQNSPNNITLIAKSTSNRYVATVSEDGHISLWDTCYLFRKIYEFDTPVLSKDGGIIIDSACLVDNSLLFKSLSNKAEENLHGFHLVLGARFIPDSNVVNKYLQSSYPDSVDNVKVNYIFNKDRSNEEVAVMIVLDIGYQFSLISHEEKITLPEFSTDDYRLNMDEDIQFDEPVDLQYPDNQYMVDKKEAVAEEEISNVNTKQSFFSDLSLFRVWNESKLLKEAELKCRDVGDTSVIHIVPVLQDIVDDTNNDCLRLINIYPIVIENDEESFNSESGSVVYLMVNVHRENSNELSNVGGGLFVYRFQVEVVKLPGIKPNIKLQNMSNIILSSGENIESMFPISFESLESNCSESSSTANADEIPQETLPTMKNTLNKSGFYWILLSNSNELYLYTTTLNNIYTEPINQSLSEVATKIHIKKELPGKISKLLLFTDMDRLCVLTDDGVMAFYSIVPKKKVGNSSKQINRCNEKICDIIPDEDFKPISVNVPSHVAPDPLIVEQEDIIDHLHVIIDFIQYEIVPGRLKLTYGCNWVEVSPLEIIDFKTNVNNFINVSRCFSSKSGVQSEPPFLISSSPYIKISEHQQCCTRTLNFRASQACSREQIIEFCTPKQLCMGHVDLRFELYEKINKNSNLIYVTLLRQQKFNISNSSKEQSTGSLKVNTSPESNIIINDLDAPFIDDDLAQYYDEINADILRHMDGDVVAGPYLLNKYCQSDSTSVFLSMTSAELLKSRSRHYAIHIRICNRSNYDENRTPSNTLNLSSSSDHFNTFDSSNLNIKSISLTLRRFSKPLISVRNERAQRLALLRNHKFQKQIFDLLVDESISKMPRPLVLQNSFEIVNWIVVMYLNDTKPHSEKIIKVISIATEYVDKLILIHLVQGDRYTSKMISKILTGLIKLESRYWSMDHRLSSTQDGSYFLLSKSIRSILLSKIDWLLLSDNSVAVHNYLLILDNLDKLFVIQQEAIVDDYKPNASLVLRLKLLSTIFQKYSETINNDEHIYLKTILGYPHNPLTGDLFDVLNDIHLTEPLNTLHSNLTEMYKKKPSITLDGSSNDSISKYLMHTFHDHSLKHIQEQLNEQINSMEEKTSSDFTILDLQKVYHKMVMNNISNNIQLMSPDIIQGISPPTIKITDTTEQISPNISNMNWPGFDPFLLSKMNPKQIIYSDMKKKLKSGHSSSVNESNSVVKSVQTTPDYIHYKTNPARKSSILEVDVLPLFFESGSEGTFLETSEFSDQSGKELLNSNDYSPNITIPLMHMIDEHNSLPVTPKTTPAITTQTTPMQNSPVQSPLSSGPACKSEILETSSILLDDINQQRLKFSQQTNNLLTKPCSYFIVVNRLHANARRHVILDLHQLSLITDIIIPSCDKLQKIIVRIGRNKNEEEMQTIVIHSKIATEPLLLLNIQPLIICFYVQIIVIAKSNITATRNRVNIGHLYGRPAMLPWEITNDVGHISCKNWCETVLHTIDQLRPQAETISIRYTMASETLKYLLNKCIKTGINQRILSRAMSEHHGKSKLPPSKTNNNNDMVQLINQVNNSYNKCCQLQQHLSIINKQMKQLQTWLSMSNKDYSGHSEVNSYQNIITVTTVDKLRVIIEFLLESLLLDKTPYLEIDCLKENIKSISGIMTNAMWFGNREMQIMIISWIPKMITKTNDIPTAIRIWCNDWLIAFLLNTFTNKNISLSPLNKEEIFSFICIIFQRLSNAGYHYQLLQNMLDILIIMLQPHPEAGSEQNCSIDIELLNWMMLFIDFILSWIDNESGNTEEQFSEWKFLFWNKTYHSSDDNSRSCTIDGAKDKMNYLKQTLLQLSSQKEVFVDYVKKCQYDPWFSQLIMNEYLDDYVKLSLKINTTLTKMKKALSLNKSKKINLKTRKEKIKSDTDQLLVAASPSIAITIKLMLNTLKCMDFQVSQDTFILTCMILNKLFVLAHESGINLNEYIEKESIYSIIQRAFMKNSDSTIGLDVYSLHACKLLLSEIVFNDIRTLALKNNELTVEEFGSEVQEKSSEMENSQDDNIPDNDSVNNEDEEDPDNDEDDITPTGADDEDINIHPDEPYTFYITHLGNIAKQKVDVIKNNEESPSDEYVDVVEEFDFIGQPTSFLPTYHKSKFPKDYQSAFKPVELEKQITVNSLDSMRPDKNEFETSHSVLYYDLRLENTIFSQQEIMFNHSVLNWMHQVRIQLYSPIPPCEPITKLPTIGMAKESKPPVIGYVLESINSLLENDVNINLEELVIFISNICHHLQKEDLLAQFDTMGICVVSVEDLLDRILEKCFNTLTSLSLYCQLICFLLNFNDYKLKRSHFQRIFQLTDSLQCQELNGDIVNNFKIIVMKSLENIENHAEFFLDILYNIVENCHRSANELRASGQLATVIIECSKSNLIECIQRNKDTFSSFIVKVISLTTLYLRNPDSFEERKCFTSLVPKTFTQQLLQVEKSLISNSSISSQSQSAALVQLNLMALDLINNKQDVFLSFADGNLLECLFETLSNCTSNILENNKLSDVTIVSEHLVRFSQNISIGDIVWRQLVKITKSIISTSNQLATELISSLLTAIQQSLPTINEPLFLASIWILKTFNRPENIDYSTLLTDMISVVVSCSDSRLSNAPLNTVTTRLAIAKMHKYNSQYNETVPQTTDNHISNSTRLNVAPYCKVFCHGNDSSDPTLLTRILTNHLTKSPLATLRSNRLKPADIYWSYEFFPNETSVEVTVILPCDMIVHKVIFHPKSIREFSSKLELTTIRDVRDTSTITYQKVHKPVCYNDGILIDNINSDQLSNKIIIRFEKPVSSRLIMSKMEIFTINQWWDHRFQISNDSSNLCVFRCLHLFNYLIGINSTSTVKFITEILPQNMKFFEILLNWNHINSTFSEHLEVQVLHKSICSLIDHMFIYLGQRLEIFSTIFIDEILKKVSVRHNSSSTQNNLNVRFTNEISIMELNIFYNLLTLNDQYSENRLKLVMKWFIDHVLKDNYNENKVLMYYDSVASVVYLLSVVLWYNVGRTFHQDLDSHFIGRLQAVICQSDGYLKKALYRLLCSICALEPVLYEKLVDEYPLINSVDGNLNHHNLSSILWASRSKSGCESLQKSGMLSILISKINIFLTNASVIVDPYTVYDDVCAILIFFAKLCISGCHSIKIWLGSADISSFWSPLLDYLINDGHYLMNMPSILKVKLINASVKFFRAVTLCCDENQTTFVKIFIESMEKYRIRSDTIVLSNCLRQLILEVIVKEPVYSVVVDMPETNSLFKQFPGWLISNDELGRRRLSFRHPGLGHVAKCIFIKKLPMTNTVNSLISEISSQMIKPTGSISFDSIKTETEFNNPRIFNRQQSGSKIKAKKLSMPTDISNTFTLTYKQITLNADIDLFDLLSVQETQMDFNCGFVKLSCSLHLNSDKTQGQCLRSVTKNTNSGYLLAKFTEYGGLKLLSMMMPLLYTDIRRVNSIGGTSYRPTTTTVTNSMGFMDDEIVLPSETNKVVKSLPLIPAHSITALCIFLHVDLYPLYLIQEHKYRSALIHLLLGITDDDCGVSLIQTYPQLQCLPFMILSNLLQDPSLSPKNRTIIINQCIDLGLIDFFISLLSIFGHVDSNLSLSSFKSSGPWASFISQSLCDLHYQLFSPTINVDKTDAKLSSMGNIKPSHTISSSVDPKSQYITFMPFIDEKKNYWAKGTGFGTGGMYSTWDSEYVLLRQRLEETNASAILDTLSAVISASDDEVDNLTEVLDDNENVLPIKAVELIYQSTLLSFICCYLRNDSVLDVSQHVNIYKSVLRLIRSTAKHRCLHYLLFPHLNPLGTNPDFIYSLNQTSSISSINVSQLLFQLKICVDTYINRLKKAPGATGKSLENTRRLTRQFSIRRKNTNYSSVLQRINDAMKTSKDGSGDTEDQRGAESENLTMLMPDINGTLKLLEDVESDILERNKKYEAENDKMFDSYNSNNRTVYCFDEHGVEHCDLGKSARDLESKYLELMKKLQFGMFEMIHPMSDENGKLKFAIPYHFKKNVENAVTSQSSAASLSRARRLAQETVTLSTSLPLSYSSSVFVRCDENHLDIMKVIIIGPPDTPYANGCFEFDVYFPPDYPKTPPLLNLQTTGNGSVRFNPNLYNEGKVCLSILNTWHGRPEERWSSRTSSFLQVLVSIQSLILVSEPYFNEPGYERSRGTPSGNNASKAYSANIQAATSRWAILEMMKNPPLCFSEVIKKHFLLKKEEIITQIQSWIDIYLEPSFDPALFNNTRPSIANSVQNLKKNLVMIKKEFENLEKENLLV